MHTLFAFMAPTLVVAGDAPSELHLAAELLSREIEVQKNTEQASSRLIIHNSEVAGTAEILQQLTGTLPSPKEVKLAKFWLQFIYKDVAAVDLSENIQPAALLRLNAKLAPQVYLLGGITPSFVDAVMYSHVHRSVGILSKSLRGNFPHLLRWFDNVQHYPEIRGCRRCLPLIHINRTFVEPVKSSPRKKTKPIPKTGAEQAKSTQKAQPEQPLSSLTSMLNIMVGRVVKVTEHPDAAALYVEEIDLGEDSPRTIVSGLRKYISKEDFLNKKVCVLANLKPAKLRGIVSQGMVLCASSEDKSHVELLLPPEDAEVGERLAFENDDGEPLPVLTPKKKIFEKVAPDLKTDEQLRAMYKGKFLLSTKGHVTSSTLKGAAIS